MIAQRTSLREEHLPDSLRNIRHEIDRTIPVGFASHKRIPPEIEAAWVQLASDFATIAAKYPKLDTGKAPEQLATMGGGNHFCEMTIDTEGFVWFVIHSGSRGIGTRIGSLFIERARTEIEAAGIALADRDLAYLTENTQSFNDYVEAVGWAQRYAKHPNVRLPALELTERAVNCHHNYVAREHHFGANVYVTRKGAVRAGEGELGIIPGSMGARSFIVRGKGNAESFESCSHGAGRRMGRKEAERRLTLADLERETAGIECRKDKGVLDEAPSAYKSIGASNNGRRRTHAKRAGSANVRDFRI